MGQTETKSENRKYLICSLSLALSLREAFLSSGNIVAYQSVRDNMGHALPALSDSVRTNHSSLLSLPEPMEPHSPRVCNTVYISKAQTVFVLLSRVNGKHSIVNATFDCFPLLRQGCTLRQL